MRLFRDLFSAFAMRVSRFFRLGSIRIVHETFDLYAIPFLYLNWWSRVNSFLFDNGGGKEYTL